MNSSRPWEPSQDTHHRLDSLKANGGQNRTTVIEGNVSKSKKSYGMTSRTLDQSASQEELAPYGNIYKETSVERRVDVFPQDRDVEDGTTL